MQSQILNIKMKKNYIIINQLISILFKRCKPKYKYQLIVKLIINKYYKICCFIYHFFYF